MSIATISKPYNFTVGTTANPTEVNSNFDTVYTGTNNAIAELNNAAGSTASLTTRLSVSLANDGTISATNINADTLDTYHASSFVLATDYEDADVLAKIKNVDGAGSGLDADSVDGFSANDLIYEAYAETAGTSELTSAIPLDDTRPLISEGTQILSVSYTPKSATNYLMVEFMVPFDTAITYVGIASVFCTAYSATGALFAVASATGSGTAPAILYGKFRVAPLGTTAKTFTLRVGPADSGTMYVNQVGSSSRIFGGYTKATLSVREIASA